MDEISSLCKCDVFMSCMSSIGAMSKFNVLPRCISLIEIDFFSSKIPLLYILRKTNRKRMTGSINQSVFIIIACILEIVM